MSHLPILIPGRTEPVKVPCRLPESITFRAFLPSRGVREFTLWLSSTDPLKAEVVDVQPTNREGDPRGPDGWALDSDEQRHADDAAADVLSGILANLGLLPSTRLSMAIPPSIKALAHISAPLHSIAKAYAAEVAAYEALLAAWEPLPARIAGDDLLPTNPAENGSLAARLLASYVDAVTDESCIAQADKAEKQAAEWQPASHPEDANPPAWAERHEVTP
jgi:hypothetical protein